MFYIKSSLEFKSENFINLKSVSEHKTYLNDGAFKTDFFTFSRFNILP